VAAGRGGGGDLLRRELLGREAVEFNASSIIRGLLVELTTCVWTVIFGMRIEGHFFF